jgi:tetratricopeptide (TPR) repeat protein
MRTPTLLILPFALVLAAFGQSSPSLQQARSQFDDRNYKEAAGLYRSAVTAEPDNEEALSGLVDSLEALGDWRGALPALEHLVTLEPSNARRIDQLGRFQSWAGDSRAVETLSRACSMDKSKPQYCTDYAGVLVWNPETRPQAIAQLRSVLAASPNYVPAIARLAEALSWDKSTRGEAAKLFQAGLNVEPQNLDLLNSYAEMLSYDRAQRELALSMYTHVLSIDPDNQRALTGKAQLLAWSGHSAEAMDVYDRLLSVNPENVAALRGKAQILNWRGHYADAYDLLERARTYAPADPQIAAELARAQLGMQRYRDAQQIVSTLPRLSDFDDVRGELARAVGRWTETGVAFRRNGNNLNYDQATVASSTMVGSANRLLLQFAPGLYSSGPTNFSSNDYAAQFDSRIGDRLSLQTAAASETYPGISPEFTGGMQARVRLNSSMDLQTGFHRSAVDDTLLSLRGVETPGGLTGQVTANLFNVGASFRNSRHGFDGSLTYTDGLYLGSGLDTNRRWALEGNFGKAIHGTPYLRLAYGFAYSQFQYDADAPVPLPNQSGGYFSPTRYLLNYAGLTVAHKFNRRLEIEATGTAGAQNAQTSTTAFGDAAFAGTFSGRLLWRVTPRDEIRAHYEYLNVFNAFHRHLPGISWRHYF